jgi:hypothetical protein
MFFFSSETWNKVKKCTIFAAERVRILLARTGSPETAESS